MGKTPCDTPTDTTYVDSWGYTVKEYWLGEARVREWPDGSVAIWPKGAGRGRSFHAGHVMAKRIVALHDAGGGDTLRELDALDRTRRSFAEGTHEPMVYYRDPEDGRIAIPPEPGMIPPGVTPLECRTSRPLRSRSMAG